MTPDLLPGPELDRAVCEAAGIALTHIRFPSGERVPAWEFEPDPIPVAAFRPSLDWNDAILLATRCGLDGIHVNLHRGPEQVCLGIITMAQMILDGLAFPLVVSGVTCKAVQ